MFSPGGRRTQWLYVAGTHQTERKIDAAGRAVDYTYHPGGLLWQRKWARTAANGDRLTTTYSYHTVSGDAEKRIPGRLAGLTYSDGLTPSVALEYRQDGRPARVQDAAGVTETQFPTGAPGGWTWGQQTLPGSGLLAGHSLSSTGPHPGFGLTFEAAPAEGSGPWVSLQRTWSGPGLLHSVSDLLAGVSHTYDREDATGRVRGMVSQVTGGAELALHRRQEREPASLGGGLAAVSYTRGSEAWTASSRVLGWRYTLSGGVRRAVRPYSVTGAGQVPEAAHGWDWTYNPRGEVISAARKRTDGSPEVLLGEVWDYEFDASGNRVRQSRGRSLDMASGQMTPYEFNAWKFLSASLTTNSTNALTSLTRAPGLEVKGAAPEGHAVSIRVNEGAEQPVDRVDWRYKLADPGGFQRPIPSGTQAEWRRVELKAQGAPETPPDIRSGWVFSPPPQETLVHDLDGNLVEDARWVYTWDAENRLIGMQEKVIPVAAGLDPTTAPKRLKLEFAYDAQHRRVMKRVKEWAGDALTGGFTTVVKDRRYVYDGWNMIAELDHTTATGTGLAGASVVRTQVWGQDLSGTMQGAGGVGGLLSVRHGGQTYVPLMDGNGNVMGLQGLGGAKDGQTVARYDYDAFGNRITNSAPELGEDVNPFGFSTKFTDEETGLVYYGYRYYSPELGRWLNRDPIGERGGINLYGMVGNDPVNFIDYLGLDTYILLYYTRSDQQAFKQAAETQKRELEASSTFNKACDKVIIKGALTSQEFETAWNQAKTETTGNDPNLKVKEVRVFSHSGPGELHFKDGSLNSQQIANLSGLNWKPDGKVVCHGCNSGVNNASGQSVAGGFAQGQGVQSLGQTGYSQFSTDPNKRGWFTRIGDSSKSVYLWSHGDGGKDNTFGPTRPPNTVPPTQQPAPQTPAPATPTPAPPLP